MTPVAMQCVCMNVVSCVMSMKALQSFLFFLHKVGVGPCGGASAHVGVHVGVYVRAHREGRGRRGFHDTRGGSVGSWDLEANVSHAAAVGKVTLKVGLGAGLGLGEDWASRGELKGPGGELCGLGRDLGGFGTEFGVSAGHRADFSADRGRPAAAVLGLHLQTVRVYADPRFGATVQGLGVLQSALCGPGGDRAGLGRSRTGLGGYRTGFGGGRAGLIGAFGQRGGGWRQRRRRGRFRTSFGLALVLPWFGVGVGLAVAAVALLLGLAAVLVPQVLVLLAQSLQLNLQLLDPLPL